MNLRQVRKKIKSISNVKKITKAMQLVSGIKMKRAQAREISGRPYRTELKTVVDKIVPGIDPKFSSLMESHAKNTKILTIVITSNKGLCGSYNVNVFRFLTKNLDNANRDFISIGKKGGVFMSRLGKSIIANYASNNLLDEVSAVFGLALEKFLKGEYSQVDIVYTKFISTLKSEVTSQTLLPVKVEILKEDVKDVWRNYVIEPAPQQIIDFLLRSYVEEIIRGAVISAEAVEHSARMIAMKNATENADDVIYNFSLLGNRLRQEKITNELLDMVTAKESVEAN